VSETLIYDLQLLLRLTATRRGRPHGHLGSSNAAIDAGERRSGQLRWGRAPRRVPGASGGGHSGPSSSRRCWS